MSATWSLECADCRLWLPTLADRSVDLVLTDPPYEIEAHTLQRRTRATLERGVVDASLPFAPIDAATRAAVAIETARVGRRWVLTFCQIEAVPLWRAAYERAGLVYKRTCLWIKPDGMPQYSGDRPGMGYEAFVAMHQPGRSAWNGGGRHGVFVCHKNDGARVAGKHQHPTQKPVRLMRELIRLFSDPGEVVGDWFAGVGSTGVAALLEGRRFVGAERDAGYAAVARERLGRTQPEGTAAIPLFGLAALTAD